MNLLRFLMLSDATESTVTTTQQQTVEAISNYGIMVVLSAIVVVTFTVMFTQFLKRQDRFDNNISDILDGVKEALTQNSIAQADSAREKHNLTEVVDNSNELIKQAIYLYQRAMEKNERDDEFLLALKEELKRHGLQQDEILKLIMEIHGKLNMQKHDET